MLVFAAEVQRSWSESAFVCTKGYERGRKRQRDRENERQREVGPGWLCRGTRAGARGVLNLYPSLCDDTRRWVYFDHTEKKRLWWENDNEKRGWSRKQVFLRVSVTYQAVFFCFLFIFCSPSLCIRSDSAPLLWVARQMNARQLEIASRQRGMMTRSDKIRLSSRRDIAHYRIAQ